MNAKRFHLKKSISGLGKDFKYWNNLSLVRRTEIL